MSADPAGKVPFSPLANSSQTCAQDAESLDLRHSELMDQAYDEYCELVEGGETVDLDEFCRRYPGAEQSVRRQIEIHNVIQEQPSLFEECCEVLWPRAGDHIMGFRLSEELGRGAFSRVFQASDTMLGERKVVIKVSQGGAHESRILGKLEHDSIVPVYSSQPDLTSGLTLICMPYLGRTTLRDVIAAIWSSESAPVRASAILAVGQTDTGNLEHQPKTLQRGSFVEGVIFVGVQIAQALAHAHKEGILHLDLKPSNVLMASGRPKILDFNLAADCDNGLPPMGGTPPYMSPEQAQCFLRGREALALDGRSDIFSLGVVLHEMLCGQLPYDRLPDNATSAQDSGKSIIDELYSNVSVQCAGSEYGGLGKIIERCLAIDPDGRYQSADELVASLQRELSAVRRGKRWIRTHRHSVLVVLGVATVLGIGTAVGVANRDPYPVRESAIGASYLEKGEYADSIEHLTRSIEVNPLQRKTLLMRAQAYIAVEDYYAALHDLNDADKLRRDGEVCALLGFCCNRLKSHSEATNWYKRALAHGFESNVVRRNLGLTYLRRMRYRSAIEVFDEAVKQGDQSEFVLRNRAVAWNAIAMRDSLQPDQALRDIEVALSFADCDPETYFCAAVICEYAGTFHESYKADAAKYWELARGLGATAGPPPSEDSGSSAQPTAKGASQVDDFRNPVN